MKTLKFKTNINCSGCVAKVSPALNNTEGVNEWHVDTGHQDKLLTVSGEAIDQEKVIAAINKIGFKANPIG